MSTPTHASAVSAPSSWSEPEPTRWSAPAPRGVTRPAPTAAWGQGVIVVAAHGGCGTTTLVEHLPAASEVAVPVLLAPSADAAAVDGVAQRAGRVCVVAAATPDGTGAAAACLHQLHAAGYHPHLVHLVVVDDGRGPLPVAVRARTRLLRPAVTGMHVLPYVPRWRYEDRSARSPSRKYHRATEALWNAIIGPPPVAPHAVPGAPQPGMGVTTAAATNLPTFHDLPAYPTPEHPLSRYAAPSWPAAGVPGTGASSARHRW